VDLRDVVVSPKMNFSTTPREDMLNGVVVITGEAEVSAAAEDFRGELYRTARPRRKKVLTARNITAIPYYAWANREPGRMQVWLMAR
jgi:DUF1680 family protein